MFHSLEVIIFCTVNPGVGVSNPWQADTIDISRFLFPMETQVRVIRGYCFERYPYNLFFFRHQYTKLYTNQLIMSISYIIQVICHTIISIIESIILYFELPIITMPDSNCFLL